MHLDSSRNLLFSPKSGLFSKNMVVGFGGTASGGGLYGFLLTNAVFVGLQFSENTLITIGFACSSSIQLFYLSNITQAGHTPLAVV